MQNKWTRQYRKTGYQDSNAGPGQQKDKTRPRSRTDTGPRTRPGKRTSQKENDQQELDLANQPERINISRIKITALT